MDADQLDVRASSADLAASARRGAGHDSPAAGDGFGLRVLELHPDTDDATDAALTGLSLCCVLEGSATLQVGPRESDCRDGGEWTALRSGDRPARLRAGAVGCLAVVVSIDPTRVLDLWSQIGRPDEAPEAVGRTIRAAVTPDLADVLGRLLWSLEPPGDHEVLAPSFALELVYVLLRSDCGSWLVGAARRELTADPISAATRYVHQNLDRPIAVADLASISGLGLRPFRRAFAVATGLSPAQYMRNVRLDQARTMLLENRHSIGEVASAVGYLSNSHFISGFRERFGSSPRAYQVRWRNGATRDVGEAGVVAASNLSATAPR